MTYYRDNKGLEAYQNKQKVIAFENALKSYSATINGINGDKELLEILLGKKDYKLLTSLGLTDFCYVKTTELYQHYPFPSDRVDGTYTALSKEEEEKGREHQINQLKEDEYKKGQPF